MAEEDRRDDENLNGRSIHAQEQLEFSNGRFQRQVRAPGHARRQHTVVLLPTLPSALNSQPTTANNENAVRNQSFDSNQRQRRRSSESDQNSLLFATQELVRLDNPRPDILRKKNEYIAVPSASAERINEEWSKRKGSQSHHPNRIPPGRVGRKDEHFSDPLNFDRPKVHLAGSGNAQNRLGTIKPLVRPRQLQETNRPQPRRPGGGGGVRGAPSSLRIVQSGGKQAGSKNSVISSQPVAMQSGVGGSGVSTSGRSIVCESCGRCRCAACGTPRKLPAGVVERCVDGASCMCCVRGCLYHFGDAGREDGDGPPQVSDSDLCSCESPGCCPRWSCLTCALIFLPCIWCYLPLKCCAALCEAAYSRLQNHGCRCRRHHSSDGFCQLDYAESRAVYDLNGNDANNSHLVIQKPNSYDSASREKWKSCGYPQGRKSLELVAAVK